MGYQIAATPAPQSSRLAVLLADEHTCRWDRDAKRGPPI